MIEVKQTRVFAQWLADLDDELAQTRIATRIVRVRNGLFGDAKSVGGSVSELRIDHGPGYRLYFTRQGRTIVILLCGGDKSSQKRDIRLAREMTLDLERHE